MDSRLRGNDKLGFYAYFYFLILNLFENWKLEIVNCLASPDLAEPEKFEFRI